MLPTIGGVMAKKNRKKQVVNVNHQKNPWFICSDRSSLAVGERAFRGGVIHYSQANNTVITLWLAKQQDKKLMICILYHQMFLKMGLAARCVKLQKHFVD